MIDINFSDPYLLKNVKAIQELRRSGILTEEQIQEMYNHQVECDKRLLDMRKTCNKYTHTIAMEGPIDICWDDTNDWHTCKFRFCPYLKKEE